MPIEVDRPAEEQGCKQNTVEVGSTGGLKMVLTLLTKLVAIYVGFPIVQVGKTSFKRIFLRPLMDSTTSLSIYKDFHELVKVRIGVFGRPGRKSRLGCRSIRGGKNRNTKVDKRGSKQWKTAAISRSRSLSTFSGLDYTGFGRVPARSTTEARAGHLDRWLDNK